MARPLSFFFPTFFPRFRELSFSLLPYMVRRLDVLNTLLRLFSPFLSPPTASSRLVIAEPPSNFFPVWLMSNILECSPLLATQSGSCVACCSLPATEEHGFFLSPFSINFGPFGAPNAVANPLPSLYCSARTNATYGYRSLFAFFLLRDPPNVKFPPPFFCHIVGFPRSPRHQNLRLSSGFAASDPSTCNRPNRSFSLMDPPTISHPPVPADSPPPQCLVRPQSRLFSLRVRMSRSDV